MVKKTSQQGFAHILLMVLLLGGLGLGVYLVGQQTFFAPKAYSPKSPLSAPVTPKPGCTAAYCPTPTKTPTPTPSVKRVFVTSTTYNGNLGGLSGADAKCQERANSVKLGGTWKAWLSTVAISTSSRLTHSATPYMRLDGKVVANNWSDLTDGIIQNLISVTELGTVIIGDPDKSIFYSVWTNTNSSGDTRSTYLTADCQDWTSNISTSAGGIGDIWPYDRRWTDVGSAQCQITEHLYCFEQ